MPFPTVLRYPDPRLGEAAGSVTAFDDALASLAGQLAAALRDIPAIGITASHFGVPSRVMAVALDGDALPRIYVNPVVEWQSDEQARHMEGSVSMPGVSEEIDRPAAVRIAYRTLAGDHATETAEGFRAAVFQHEIDQMDGIFWIERLSRLRRDRLLRRWKKAAGR